MHASLRYRYGRTDVRTDGGQCKAPTPFGFASEKMHFSVRVSVIMTSSFSHIIDDPILRVTYSGTTRVSQIRSEPTVHPASPYGDLYRQDGYSVLAAAAGGGAGRGW